MALFRGQKLAHRLLTKQVHFFHQTSWNELLSGSLLQPSTVRSLSNLKQNFSSTPKIIMDGDPSVAAAASLEIKSAKTNDGDGAPFDVVKSDNQNSSGGSRTDKHKKQKRGRDWSRNKKKKDSWYRNRGEKRQKTEGDQAIDRPKNSRRQEDWESKAPQTTPHEGSFAHGDMQKLFNVHVNDTVPKKQVKVRDDAADTTLKIPKRKLGMLVSFLGSNYGGFQINAGQRSLQAEIELALYRAGMIAPSNFGWPSKYSWSNSARTDKGVHAAAQVVSLKGEMIFHSENDDMPISDQLNAMRESVNDHLPDDIRILDFERVTRQFCARTNRDKVRYQVRNRIIKYMMYLCCKF